MKKLLIFLFVLCLQTAKSQVYQLMPQYGYDTKRMNFDSTLSIPTFCGVPSLRSNVTKKAAIAYDSCNKRFYYYDPKLMAWDTIKGGNGGSVGTLQQVTDNDNLTTNDIYVNSLYLYDGSSDAYANINLGEDLWNFNSATTSTKNFTFTSTYLNASRTYYLPDGFGVIPLQVNGIASNTNGVITLPLIDSLKRSRDSVFAKKNGSWVFQYKDSIGSGGSSIDTTSLSNRINLKLNISDTANKWVSSVTKLNDSTIRVIKDGTTSDISITSASSAKRLETSVYNNTGSTITKGSVVYINGRHSSNLPTIALAQANTEVNSYSTFALVKDDISTSSSGIVIQAGNIGNLNLPTSTYTDGQLVYLSPSVAGGITTTKPLAPNHIVKIGTITRAHPTLGSIELKIENGWQLDELSDVQISPLPNDSTILQFSRVDSLWHSVRPDSAIGSRYIKPSDTATMLNPYQTKFSTDTMRTNLYGTLNGKLNISDTSTMLSKYLRRSDTTSMLTPYLRKSDTTSMLSPYLRSVNAFKYTDTSSMLSPYLRKADTTSMLSPYDRKYMAAYSMNVNNTNAGANVTTTTYKQFASASYTGGITWTGTTAPSGSTNHTYSWEQVGKLVTLRINLVYGTAGATLTQVACALPSDCPTPESPSGIGAANDVINYGSGVLTTSLAATGLATISMGYSALRVNSSANGYEIVIARNSINARYAYATIQYFAQ